MGTWVWKESVRKEGGDKVHVLQGAAWEAVIVREHVLCLLCITDCSNNC